MNLTAIYRDEAGRWYECDDEEAAGKPVPEKQLGKLWETKIPIFWSAEESLLHLKKQKISLPKEAHCALTVCNLLKENSRVQFRGIGHASLYFFEEKVTDSGPALSNSILHLFCLEELKEDGVLEEYNNQLQKIRQRVLN